MGSQLLIYERAVPVSSQRHGKWSVDIGANYAFSRNVNSVPLMAVEFPFAAPEYPIVFAGAGAGVMPAVILGVGGQENLFLTPEGAWQAKYIPAFVRRYPFVFSAGEDDKTFTLCIDEAFGGFNKAARGQRLFDAKAKPSEYLQGVLKFLQEYQVQFYRTRAFCAKLKQLGLLDPVQAQITLGSDKRTSLTGLQAVNRDRLKALAGDKLAELAKTDELELIFLHLQSLRNFSGIGERLASHAPALA